MIDANFYRDKLWSKHTMLFILTIGVFVINNCVAPVSSLSSVNTEHYAVLEDILQVLVKTSDFLDLAESSVSDVEEENDLFFGLDLPELNDNGTEEDNGTTPVCASCKAAIATLKAIVAATEWNGTRDVVVDICYRLAANISDDIRADVLCPGVVDLQGPHIYEVLSPKYRKSPEDVCRNLNACFPPKNDQEKAHIKTKQFPKKSHKKSLEERKKEAVTIVQLADIHIEPEYAEGTETDCGLPVCCVPGYGNGSAGAYGDYECNIPQRTMDLFLAEVDKFQPEFVIYSGDSPPHSIWVETYDSQLLATQMLVDSMTRLLSDYTIYPAIGNHEMYPTNLYSMEYLPDYTPPMSEEFAELWTDLADFTPENIETMSAGGYYTAVASPGVRIIVINTNYWYSFNWYNVLNEFDEEQTNQMEFIAESFQTARDNNEKVILVGHHPLGGADALVTHTRLFQGIVAEYTDLIVLHVAGHTHNDEFKVMSVDTTPSAVLWVAPCATGWSHDPSMRVFYLDSETLEVLDYEKYGFILEDVIGSSDVPNITLQYSAMDEYGLADMSPQSWADLTDRMESDDDLFHTYYSNYIARPLRDSTCEERCKVNLLCNTRSYQYDEIYYCSTQGEL